MILYDSICIYASVYLCGPSGSTIGFLVSLGLVKLRAYSDAQMHTYHNAEWERNIKKCPACFFCKLPWWKSGDVFL